MRVFLVLVYGSLYEQLVVSARPHVTDAIMPRDIAPSFAWPPRSVEQWREGVVDSHFEAKTRSAAGADAHELLLAHSAAADIEVHYILTHTHLCKCCMRNRVQRCHGLVRCLYTGGYEHGGVINKYTILKH